MSPSCPVCDGEGFIERPCPKCQSIMEDCGTISDYYDPYSPYEENKLGFEDDYSDECHHFLKCTSCEYQEDYPVRIMEQRKWDEFYD